jgi:glutamate N-acetyltransferase/amino-acid N-acetyltransferase
VINSVEEKNSSAPSALVADLPPAKGAIVKAKGFKAKAAHIGIKANSEKLDLAVIASDAPANVAAVFTTNVVKAACITWNQAILDAGKTVRAIVVNSGNANACTGLTGVHDTQTMAEACAGASGFLPKEVLIASTGVIGVPLPMAKLTPGIAETSQFLEDSIEAGASAAQAITTTDLFTKEFAVSFEIAGKNVTIGGMAKGSGMIHPNMATMLGFLTTDAVISPGLLQKALSETVKETYNMISVDGDTSTNDMVCILANGKALNKPIEEEDGSYQLFVENLKGLNRSLAKSIVADGEGATKLLEVTVAGAKSIEEARVIARSIVSSSLVKAAFFGEDANWGRILAAMGYSGAQFDPAKVTIEFVSPAGRVLLMKDGTPVSLDEDAALKVLKEKNISILIDLADGHASGTAWGCDLSYEYVRINGSYRT